MSKYYVYHGYSTVYGPRYKISEFDTDKDVLDFKQKFDGYIHDGCSDIRFRVFCGVEMEVKVENSCELVIIEKG